MNKLVYFYIILYVAYLIFGPHFITRFLRGKDLRIVKNFDQFIKRVLFLSYISLLYNAYYFYNPNIETFINALIVNFISLLGFSIKWNERKRDLNSDYYPGIFMHVLVVIPVILSFYKNNLKINRYKYGMFSKITTIFLIIYIVCENYIYNSGVDFKRIFF